MGALGETEQDPSRAPAKPRVVAFQFDVRRGDVASNLRCVEEGLLRAAESGVDLVVLPEMWPTSFVDLDQFEERWLPETEAALERVRQLSQELNLMVAGSAFAQVESDPRPRNRLVVFDQGREILIYDKVHLFSPTAEGESFSAGSLQPPTVDTRLGKVSGCLCYDLRFSALLRAPFLEEAEILVVPAQWPAPRDPHWNALVLGRAVECQAFVVACNRTGIEHVGRRRMELSFPGNSLVVDPHGVALATGNGKDGPVQASLDMDDLRRLRRRVPVRRDDRGALYAEWAGKEARGRQLGH